MKIFGFSKEWSSGQMTQEDRKLIFWYLKRRTSYTAWKREADAFDVFVELFERQVREEPIGPAVHSIEDTNWEMFYTDVLKTQVHYEEGLNRLLQGDRSVFLYNSRGSLSEAKSGANHWYSELVNRGARGDHFYDGKYAAEMTAALLDFCDKNNDTGCLQAMISDTPAPEFWSTLWRQQLSDLPFPSILAEVPVVQPALTVKTGKNVPVFGIYEPQIEDGCMNYLLGDTPAPALTESDGIYATGNELSVVWKLLWEDTRYLDGSIPAEERLYFPPKKPAPLVAVSGTDALLYAETSEICPKDGEWAVMNDLTAKTHLHAGDKMPKHNDQEVIWVYLN